MCVGVCVTASSSLGKHMLGGLFVTIFFHSFTKCFIDNGKKRKTIASFHSETFLVCFRYFSGVLENTYPTIKHVTLVIVWEKWAHFDFAALRD